MKLTVGRYSFHPTAERKAQLIEREVFPKLKRKPKMTPEQRAAVILNDLDSYNKLDRVAWLATVLREFEREIRNERVTMDYGDLDKLPDGENK